MMGWPWASAWGNWSSSPERAPARPVDAGDAVGGFNHRADLGRHHAGFEALDLLTDDGGNFLWANGHAGPPGGRSAC